MTRLVVGPFNRVEGDLEVTLDVDDGHVRSAQVNAPMFRGFEQILLGRDALDALVVVPRICGICSVSQSAAAAAALARAMGVTPPPDGWRVAQLIQATENLADHLTHFYTFFMPDFAREAYRGHAWFEAVHARFKATVGSAVRDALPARMAFMQAMGLLAGKWPHTLTLQPGGTAQALQASQRLRLVALLAEFRRWLEERLFGDVLEAVVALPDAAALRRWVAARLAQAGTTPADLPLFLQVADDLQLWQTGRATDRYLATDSYLGVDGPLMRGGVWADGRVQPFDPSDVAEDLTHAWLAADGPVQSPSQGLTVPLVDKPGAYTWCKAPRWRGQVLETGALARQMVDGLPLLRDVVAQHGGSVAARVLARLVEVARVLPAMQRWALALVPGQPTYAPGELPAQAHAVGLVEAARGTLGHWVGWRDGRIAHCQIVAPTTWNFSPRDAAGTPGALEQALVGVPVRAGEATPLMVQHVVRSFDPCMVCTVH
jgi:Ni,Fe-hydrogenase I large subunit